MATAIESSSLSPSPSGTNATGNQAENGLYFEFPLSDDAEPPSLSSLTNEDSSFHAVSQACFHLHQYQLQPVLHDATISQFWSDAWKRLLQCTKEHSSRQCRILAATTAARTARSVYGQIRPIVQLYAQREPTPSRVEDEVLDVALGLVNAALAEEDDGVAVSLLGAVGNLVLTSNTRYVLD